jgi:putative multiple sugar transport system permease protein
MKDTDKVQGMLNEKGAEDTVKVKGLLNEKGAGVHFSEGPTNYGQLILSVLKKNSMLIALIVVLIFFGFSTGGTILVPRNVSNLIFQNAYVAILAVGMLLCILTGGNIDLSVGSSVCLVGAIAGELMIVRKMPVLPSIILCLFLGLLIGIWQGFWIAYIGIPPFIATLAGQLVFRGLSLIVLNGLTLAPFPDAFQKLSTGHIPDFLAIKGVDLDITCIAFGVVTALVFLAIKITGRFRKIKKGYAAGNPLFFYPITGILACIIVFFAFWLARYEGLPTVMITLIFVVIVYAVLTSMTVPGRYLYALGGNPKAARMSGIDPKKVMFFAYANMSFLAGIAGLVFAARLNSANPTAGQNFELDAIASCFIGGASAYGGIGTVSGVLIGAAFMGIMNNGMNFMGFQTAAQQVVKGMVLLLAVAFDVMSKKKSR